MEAARRRLGAALRHLRDGPGRPARAVAAAQQPEEEGADIVPFGGPQDMGAEVTGLDIRTCLRAGWAQGHPDGGVEYLNEMVAEHKLLLFRNQLPRLTAEELVLFSQWFGSGQLHAAHAQHPESEHFDVFRVSNDPAVGCWEERGVGTGGFHNDGAFMPAPYSHAVYQIVKPSDLGGGTHYANINKCLGDYATLSAENYARTLDFERIRTVSDVTGLEFPLGYKHPVTGKAVILNAGMRQASRITMAGKRQVGKDELGKEELRELRRTIVDLMENDDARYEHQWQAGDIIVTDNLAVMHRADPSAGERAPRPEGASERYHLDEAWTGGLRILHRTTVLGTHVLGEGTVTLAPKAN